MKKKILVFLLSCFIISILGATAYAYLTDEENAVNEIGIAQIDTPIQEEFEPPPDPDPGDVITKKPCVENVSAVEVYVRASVRFSDSDAEKQCEPLKINAGWSLAGDGYYYYSQKLLPGEKTSSIFDEVTLKSGIAKEDQLPFELLVYAESVQTHGFANAPEAFAAMEVGA